MGLSILLIAWFPCTLAKLRGLVPENELDLSVWPCPACFVFGFAISGANIAAPRSRAYNRDSTRFSCHAERSVSDRSNNQTANSWFIENPVLPYGSLKPNPGDIYMKHARPFLLFALLLAIILPQPLSALAPLTNKAKDDLTRLLLGKDVKALLDMPAYKDGIDIYYLHTQSKHLDDRGIDLKDLSKYLREKGVGVERDEWVTITNVKIDNNRVEIHLGGGGEGRGASKNAEKKGAGFKRAGGSRINFRFGTDLSDADLQKDNFLSFLGRVLDLSRIRDTLAVEQLNPELKDAIHQKRIIDGMTYQMVLLSAGEPDQKKVEDTTDDSLKETWYYLKDGHRWVVKFLNGKVTKIQIF